jgi:hypothetical protein
VGAVRMIGAVLGIVVLGSASGYAAGHFALPEQVDGRHSPDPAQSPTPVVTPGPKTKRTAPPNNEPALRVEDIDYREQQFAVEADVRATVKAEVPKGWRGYLQQNGDEWKFTKMGVDRRFIRIRSGYNLYATPAQAAKSEIQRVTGWTPYEADLKMAPPKDGTMVGEDGQKRTYSTVSYTFISEDQGERLVIVRFVALPGSEFSAVELGVGGLPKDLKALTSVLDRATKTVIRNDED